MQYILNETYLALNYDFILLIFSSNLIIFVFYFLTLKTNLLKINKNQAKQIIRKFEINLKNSEKLFFPIAIIWLSNIVLTVVSTGIDILELRRILSQNLIYNCSQIIISSFSPIIFSKCITDKPKNFLKIKKIMVLLN